MSSGKKTQTTTSVTNNDPPAWSTPYFQQALTQAGNLSNQQYTPYTGERVAGAGMMNPYASNEHTDSMVGQLTSDISGRYQNATAPGLMGQFNAGGAFGGSAHQQAMEGAQGAFARELGNASNNLRFEQANNQRDEWTSALGRLQANDDANYGMYLDERDFAANRQGLLTNALASIRGGTSSGSSTGANPDYRSAGQNAAGYAALIASMYGSGG